MYLGGALCCWVGLWMDFQADTHSLRLCSMCVPAEAMGAGVSLFHALNFSIFQFRITILWYYNFFFLSGDRAAFIKMYSQAEVFLLQIAPCIELLKLADGAGISSHPGIVFRKRNTLCFMCQTLILTHPSWERSQTSWSCLLVRCQWREHSWFL